MLECVPDGVARMVTDSVDVPTIGIGAGRHCDGQVLVFHDLCLGASRAGGRTVRVAVQCFEESATLGVSRFVDDVREGRYPSSDETYHMTDQMGDAFDLRKRRSPRKHQVGTRAPEIAVDTAAGDAVAPPV